MPRSKSVTKIREHIKQQTQPFTLTDIRMSIPELKAQQISSCLCYLLKENVVKRELIENTTIPRKRPQIWQYVKVTHEN